MKEQEIQKQIKDYLEYSGWLVVKFNNAGIRKENGSYIPTHQVGVSDLLCCSPKGCFVAIEVKKPGNKPTLHQQAFIEAVRRVGGKAFVATSLDDLIEKLSSLG